MTTGRGPRVHLRPDRIRIEIRGALDIDAREGLLDAIRALPDGPPLVEIDLRMVEFLDSSGLSGLVAADRLVSERSGRRPRILVADSGPVVRMLQLTLLHLTLDVRAA